MGTLSNLRVAIYARFSSANQRDTSIDDQVRKCRDFIAANGGLAAEDLIFADYSVSAASLVRGEFDRLYKLVLASPRKIDVIVTENTDRISRDVGDADRFFKQVGFADVRLICVSDGIDSSLPSARMLYGMKAMMADQYLENLRVTTLRGLEGAAERGFSTGGLPLGYISRPIMNGGRDPLGYEILIDEGRAAVIRRIFAMYRDGYSPLKIAEHLNVDAVRPPRSGNNRRPGWLADTIGHMLLNEAYIGKWTFKKRQWRKPPGTNKRRPKMRAESEVQRQERPHLRIIEQGLWDAVQQRRSEVASKRAPSQGRPTAPARRTNYPFSGLLVCSQCDAPMVIIGGSSSRFYRCGDAHKRGTCQNKLVVREAAVVDAAVAKLKDLLREPGVLDIVRGRIEEKLKTFVLRNEDELKTARRELGQAEDEIEKLMSFIRRIDPETNPGALSAVASNLEIMTKKRETLRARVATIQIASSTPVRAPTPDEVAKVVLDVEAHLRADPIVAREALRRLLQGGRITMEPQADGTYRGSSWILSLALVGNAKTKKPRNSFESEASAEPTQGSVYSDGCAGRI